MISAALVGLLAILGCTDADKLLSSGWAEDYTAVRRHRVNRFVCGVPPLATARRRFKYKS